MIRKLTGLFIFFITISQFSFAQTKEQIRAEQRALHRELTELNTNLSQVKKTHKASLGQLKMIEEKIAMRQTLINNISKDIKNLDQQIVAYNTELNKYRKELDTLKSNYAKSLVEAYKRRNSYDYINFLFSANSFNDAYKRMQYLKSYRSYRDAQVSDIKSTQTLIQGKLNDIANLKGNKNTALNTQSTQLKGLESDKIEKDETIKQLIDQEGDLAVEIADREKRRDQLRRVLQDVIRKEIAEAQRQEQERLARIAAARIAEQERLARVAAEKAAAEKVERERRERQAQVERERREREEAAKAAAEAERQRKLTEERIAKEKAERAERQEREKRAMEERLAREKADKERQAERDRQLRRIEERNKAIDEANARDLARKRAEETKAKEQLEKIEKENAATNVSTAAVQQESQEEIKRRVEQEVREENRQVATNMGRSYNVLESSKENMTQSLDFEKNRGGLPWPASGYVSQPFGNYTLPGSKIREYNPGIEITSNGDPGVRSVANGIVSVVINMDDGYTVIVRHGKYFTTYNHLASVSVSKGQNVQSGTHLGNMRMGEYGKPSMLFMVSDDKGNELNPSSWLR